MHLFTHSRLTCLHTYLSYLLDTQTNSICLQQIDPTRRSYWLTSGLCCITSGRFYFTFDIKATIYIQWRTILTLVTYSVHSTLDVSRWETCKRRNASHLRSPMHSLICGIWYLQGVCWIVFLARADLDAIAWHLTSALLSQYEETWLSAFSRVFPWWHSRQGQEMVNQACAFWWSFEAYL